ncbi:MAG TPA: hypothetical protein VGS16_10900 [Candidatus Dormibacteraeota bacterium]|nr:hypothetical protein [Candidatus Dormibacteraeota bacterium]
MAGACARSRRARQRFDDADEAGHDTQRRMVEVNIRPSESQELALT